MATETTRDGSISGNESVLNTVVTTELPDGGTSFTTTAPAEQLDVVVAGTQTWSGQPLSGSVFRFEGSAPSNALFTPQNKLELNLDSSKNKFKGSSSEDSIAFRKKSTKDVVKLGEADGAADRVEIKSEDKVKDLKIKNFGKEDSLKVGKKTFDYDQLQDKSFKNISIKFD